MENPINDIDDLIGKVLTGEATEEERLRLEAWTSLTPDNRKYVGQLKDIFEKAVSPAVAPDFDTEAAWQKMKSKLGGNHGLPDSSWSFAPGLRIAAGIILLMIAGIFAYRQYYPPVETFVIASNNLVAHDTLPDGSQAFLNRRSTIRYEYNPRHKVRKVKLSGESFFDVRHEEEKPFVIEAQEVLIRDIGTTFNVRAWPEKDTVEVLVKTGEVQFYTLLDSGLTLRAGETGIYSRSTRTFSRTEKSDVNVLAYQTGELNFIDAELKVVIEKVNEVYESHIRLENPALETCRLTVSFHHDTLDTVVDVIAETMKLSITRKDNEILLNGKGCN